MKIWKDPRSKTDFHHEIWLCLTHQGYEEEARAIIVYDIINNYGLLQMRLMLDFLEDLK